MRKPILAVYVGLVLTCHAAAGDAITSPIATDRPAVTDSSIVAPIGSVQAENGFTDTDRQGQATLDGPETLLRIGLASKTELRLTVPDYFGQPGMSSGFGDFGHGGQAATGADARRVSLTGPQRECFRFIRQPSRGATT